MKKIILIPAYQPEHKLIELLGRLSCCRDMAILVVDDGSGPNYRSVFEQAELFATVLSYEENRGKGAALKYGLSFIRNHFVPPYVVVTADADGQHSAEDIIRVGDKAAENPRELILGTRKIGRKVPLRSRFGNTVTRAVFRRASGMRVYDTQTGLRGFSDQSLLFMLRVPGERYEYEMNMLLLWAGNRSSIREVWIRTIYLGDNSSSHFDTLRDSFRIYRDIFRYCRG